MTRRKEGLLAPLSTPGNSLPPPIPSTPLPSPPNLANPRFPHQELPLSRRLKRLYIVSISQFRPEKQHALQLRAFARARREAERLESDAGDAVLAARLELVGGCRNAEDAARIEDLKGGWEFRRRLGLLGAGG